MLPAPESSKTDGLQFLVQQPANRASLTQRRTMFCSTVVRIVSRVYLRAMSAKRAQLVRSDVAQRQTDRHGRVPGLPLAIYIRVVPLLKLSVWPHS